jgi:hypothetical protein
MAKLGDKEMTLEEKQAILKAQAIIHAESLYHYKLIGRAIGKDEDTLKGWRDTDKDFSDSIEQARTRFLQKRIKDSRPEFLLERLEPEIFKERKELDANLKGEVQFINSVPRPKP